MSYPEPDEFDNQSNQTKDIQVDAQKDQVLRQILQPDARARLSNVKMVKPELASLVENYLINMVTQGKVNGQLSDDQLKQILLSIQQPKRDFKINRR